MDFHEKKSKWIHLAGTEMIGRKTWNCKIHSNCLCYSRSTGTHSYSLLKRIFQIKIRIIYASDRQESHLEKSYFVNKITFSESEMWFERLESTTGEQNRAAHIYKKERQSLVIYVLKRDEARWFGESEIKELGKCRSVSFFTVFAFACQCVPYLGKWRVLHCHT